MPRSATAKIPEQQLLGLLAAPRRREILRLVWVQERSAGEIHAALSDVTFGAISQHLKVLESAGALSVRRDGRQRFYRTRPDSLGPFRKWLEAMWDDSLYDLKLRAELDEARRGPKGTSSRHSRPNNRRRR